MSFRPGGDRTPDHSRRSAKTGTTRIVAAKELRHGGRGFGSLCCGGLIGFWNRRSRRCWAKPSRCPNTEGFEKGGTLELWAGGAVADGVVNNGVLLGSLLANDADLIHGKFLPFQTEITATSSEHPSLLGGELLSVRFVSNGRESNIDNIQLSNVVPAPSSLATLLGVGVMVVGMEWWKKRRRRVSTTA